MWLRAGLSKLGGRFGYFLFFFFCSGGEGESEAPVGWVARLFIENPRRGGVSRARERGARGWEGVCGEWGGGGVFFLFGAEMSTKKRMNL